MAQTSSKAVARLRQAEARPGRVVPAKVAHSAAWTAAVLPRPTAAGVNQAVKACLVVVVVEAAAAVLVVVEAVVAVVVEAVVVVVEAAVVAEAVADSDVYLKNLQPKPLDGG